MEQERQTGFLQIPHNLSDAALRLLPGDRFKVFYFIYRKTIGWQRVKDEIPAQQFLDDTGIKSKQTVYSHIGFLEDCDLIACERAKGKTTVYGLALGDNELVEKLDQSEKWTSPEIRLLLVQILDRYTVKLVQILDTQKKGSKETIKETFSQKEIELLFTYCREVASLTDSFIESMRKKFGEQSFWEIVQRCWVQDTQEGNVEDPEKYLAGTLRQERSKLNG